jgi:hypothetical protein
MKNIIILALIRIGIACPHMQNGNSHLEEQSHNVTAKIQLDMLWNKVTNSSDPKSYHYSKIGFFAESMEPSVSLHSDEMPITRKKVVHSAGVVSKVRFETHANNFTGIFQGVSHGLLRYSLTNEPRDINHILASGALKFPRTNTHSANILFARGMTTQESSNIFEHDMSNHLPSTDIGLAGKLVLTKFSHSPSDYPEFTGLSDAASYDINGNRISLPIYPFQLLFKPRKEAITIVDNELKLIDQDYIYGSLLAASRVPSDTALWDIFANNGPKEPFYQIGTLFSESLGIASEYGDNNLFFKHQKFDEDIADGTHGATWKTECPQPISCSSCHFSYTCRFY